MNDIHDLRAQGSAEPGSPITPTRVLLVLLICAYLLLAWAARTGDPTVLDLADRGLVVLEDAVDVLQPPPCPVGEVEDTDAHTDGGL